LELLGREDTVQVTNENDNLHKLVMMLKEINFVTPTLRQDHNVWTLIHSHLHLYFSWREDTVSDWWLLHKQQEIISEDTSHPNLQRSWLWEWTLPTGLQQLWRDYQQVHKQCSDLTSRSYITQNFNSNRLQSHIGLQLLQLSKTKIIAEKSIQLGWISGRQLLYIRLCCCIWFYVLIQKM
jgi:hypothetical protein